MAKEGNRQGAKDDQRKLKKDSQHDSYGNGDPKEKRVAIGQIWFKHDLELNRKRTCRTCLDDPRIWNSYHFASTSFLIGDIPAVLEYLRANGFDSFSLDRSSSLAPGRLHFLIEWNPVQL